MKEESEIAARFRILKIAVTLTVVLSLAIVLLVSSSSMVGIILRVGTGGQSLPRSDFSAVPQSVVADATSLATELYGDYQKKSNDFMNQLLALYLEAGDKDFVIFFNPGGWGWNILEASSQWHSIITGIQSELDNLGYTSLALNYQRTEDTLSGYFDEAMSMASLYPSKARDLASRAEFLTKHISDLRVIITGESTGTVIAGSAMRILVDNMQVYSIQTGPPFWYKNNVLDRTLVLRSSGITLDAFSRGDIFSMISASLENLFGFPRSEENAGNILYYVGAPGHEYWWYYPGVSTEITPFLQRNFGLK